MATRCFFPILQCQTSWVLKLDWEIPEFYVTAMFCFDWLPLRNFLSVCVDSLQSNHCMGIRWRSSKPLLEMFPSRDPSLSRLCTSVKFLWDSNRPLPALTEGFVISSSLTSLSPTDQSWKPTGLPGHHQRGGIGWDLCHHRALCPVQVWHPHPEDR